MAHELWVLKKNNTMTNITPLLGSISWRSNIDELGEELTFDIAFNDDKFFPKNPCELGDIVILKNDVEINRFMIVEDNRSANKVISYIAFDFGFHLNKSSAVYQFNQLMAHDCIRKIVTDFNIPIDFIVNIPVQITKIYVNETVSEIIKDILDYSSAKTNKKYLMEFRKGKFCIDLQPSTVISATFKLYEELAPVPIMQSLSNPTRRRSVVDMVNKVLIVKDDKVIHTKANNNLINDYGILQKTVSMSDDSELTASQLAQKELNELGRIIEENSIELLGDDKVRAGRLLNVIEERTGMNGVFVINDVVHSISNGIHKMSISLGGK